jgi:type III pantothenate kinase
VTPVKKKVRPTAHGPALLAVDVGNSETTLGVFQEDDLVLSWRLRSIPRTPDETLLLLRQLLGPEAIDLAGLPSVLCSVVPPVTADFARALEVLTGTAPVVVGADTVQAMPIRYKDPSAVGPDRLANAVAVRELYGTPAIVVDLGTATTFDVVGEDGDYLGGAITPGLMVSAEELFRRAARLGRIELKRPERVIGRTPEESMQAGIVLGHAGLVDSLVTRILVELGGDAHVVATGGLARLLAGEATTIEHVDEGLTLKGLRLIHGAAAHPEALAAWTRKQEQRARLRAAAGRDDVEPVAAPERVLRVTPRRRATKAAVEAPAPVAAPVAAPEDDEPRKKRRGRRGGRRGRH